MTIKLRFSVTIRSDTTFGQILWRSLSDRNLNWDTFLPVRDDIIWVSEISLAWTVLYEGPFTMV